MRLPTAILALSIVSAPAVAAAAATAPKAVAVESSHDFGTVPPVEVLQHAFEIRNDGTATLEIEKVVADCKCTATNFDRTIAPGALGKVTAAVDTRVLEGQVTGTLKVYTNDPQNAVLQLRTQVDVQSHLLAKPGYARWNMVQGEKEGTISQTVWSTDSADFRVLRVDAPPSLRTSFRPAQGDELRKDVKGAQWHVEAAVKTQAPIGAIVGYFEVVTDHPTQPILRIPISGFVRPVVHVTPPTGDFGAISLDKERKAVFHFQNFATEKIAIVKAESTVKGIQVEVTPVEEGRSYTVELILPATLPVGDFKGAVRIQTDSAKAPMVEIPLSGTITKPPAEGATAGR